MSIRATTACLSFRIGIIVASVFCLSLPAHASGTLGAGGSDPYALGKRVYQKQLACEDCPVSGGVNDADAARALLVRVEQDEFQLSPRNRRAVVSYLKRRWRLE